MLGPQGDRNRRLWKATCLRLAREVCASATQAHRHGGRVRAAHARAGAIGTCTLPPQNSLDKHERALFGLLAGDTEHVLPVCMSWEDHVWAHYTALIEFTCEQVLRVAPTVGAETFDNQPELATVVPAPALAPANLFERLRSSDNRDLRCGAYTPRARARARGASAL